MQHPRPPNAPNATQNTHKGPRNTIASPLGFLRVSQMMAKDWGPFFQPSNTSEAAPMPFSVAEASVDENRLLNTISSDKLGHKTSPEEDYHDQVMSMCVQQLGSPFPNYDTLRAYEPSQPAGEDFKAHIDGLRSQHDKELAALHELHAAQLAQLAEDQRLTVDEAIGIDERTAKWLSKQGAHLREHQSKTHHALMTSHLLTLHPLRAKYIAQNPPPPTPARDPMPPSRSNVFPTTIEAFNALDSKAKFHVARYLNSNRQLQPSMSNERTAWTEQDSEILWALYKRDPAFKAKVEQLVQSKKSTDPRLARK